MAALVSIIIPFYNQEQYLGRAVASVLAQSYTAIELLLVDDGSTDLSHGIAAACAERDTRVRVISCAHHSIGKARNTGIRHATGVYLSFLDSDDELEPNAIEHLMKHATATKADAVVGSFTMCRTDATVLQVNKINRLPQRVSAQEAIALLLRGQIASVVWAKLFRTDLARKQLFPEGILFEDGPFLLSCFDTCTSGTAFCEESIVRHYCRPGSETRKLTSVKRIADTYAAFRLSWDYILQPERNEPLQILLFAYYQKAFLNNLVMLVMDRKKGGEQDLQRAYRQYTELFFEARKAAGLPSGPRTLLDAAVMRMYRWLGWPLMYRLLPLLNAKTFRKITAIRDSGASG
ncbi:glycosyltransferase family 2 protein [Rurimicrobium arvi]|uniref:Glycosyltransferase 2-like domain-containing protein n=1 Tax=Rurimicrobium arvi TaxID=2049916 RepID=A0ABP8MXC1_9BACT